MADKLKWGLIGTGSIARKFAAGLRESRTGELAAIGSRSEESARAFSGEFPAAVHGSYESLLADPTVEAVYISTPHPMHAEWAIKAADAGKHVLCEKPMTMTLREAEEVVAAARRNDVFLMEAFMYRCHPQTAKIAELIREKAIGDVKLIRATFSFAAPFRPESRLFSAELGGGGILDVGCYCASMARFIAGVAIERQFSDPEVVAGAGHIGQTGVDEYSVATLKFPGDIVAQLAAGVRLTLENNVAIAGTAGTMLIPSPWVVNGGKAGFSKIILFRDGIPTEVLVEADRGIYALEADNVTEHIAQRQSPAMSWDDTLGNMRVLERWRACL